MSAKLSESLLVFSVRIIRYIVGTRVLNVKLDYRL